MKYKSIDYERANAVPLIMVEEFSKWCSKNNDPLFLFGLYHYRKKEFLKTWGKQNFCWTSCRRYHVWVHELSHCKVWVLVNKDTGVCFEFSDMSSKQAGKEVVKFIKDFVKTFVDTDPELQAIKNKYK